MKCGQRNILHYLLFAALLMVTLIASTGAAQASLGIDFSASAPYENGGPSTFGASSGYTIIGWSFTPTIDLSLNRLGIYDADVDRMHMELHQVGIWSASDQSTPLTSVSISEYNNTPIQSPQGAYFHWVDVNSIALKAGQTYFVGATLFSGLPTNNSANSTDFDTFASINNEVPVTLNQYIKYISNAYGISDTNSLTFPNLTYSPATYTIGANIDVTPTPIPAAAWLLGSGLMGLVGIRRKMQD